MLKRVTTPIRDRVCIVQTVRNEQQRSEKPAMVAEKEITMPKNVKA